jgi:hypothetical protein
MSTSLAEGGVPGGGEHRGSMVRGGYATALEIAQRINGEARGD